MTRFIHTPLGISLVSTLGAGLYRGLGAIVRLDVRGEENIPTVLSYKKPVIVTLWHGRHFLLTDKFRRRFADHINLSVMASRSRDGEILARVLQKLHFKVIRGSSSRGGVQGLLELIDGIKDGYDTILAVDGPRGPREIVKPGVILLAQKTGSPILPVSASAFTAKVIHSWDRFLIPYPFTKGIVTIGEPIVVPDTIDKPGIEAKRKALEDELNRITRLADIECNRLT
jgi:lysophospholipid acyltransferase (LPLAT)-like uncharacterized protein